jgi:hypothetical protein
MLEGGTRCPQRVGMGPSHRVGDNSIHLMNVFARQLTLIVLSIAELVFWTIVGGLRSRKTKEESQPPVRATVGATLVLCRSQNQL